MDNKELKILIIDSKNNKDQATNQLLEKYQGMIKCYSFMNGKLQEELKQDLICKTIESI